MPELWLQVALLASATALPLHLCEPALGRGLATLTGSETTAKVMHITGLVPPTEHLMTSVNTHTHTWRNLTVLDLPHIVSGRKITAGPETISHCHLLP